MVELSQKLFKILLIVFSGILTLTLLVGGTYIYNNKFYAEPIEEIVTTLPAVKMFEINKETTGLRIKVQFSVKEKLRTNFYTMLDQLEGQVKNNSTNIVIEINNEQSNELGQFLTDSRLPIFQAIATGAYTQLPSYISLLADQKGIAYNIEIDNHFIFLSTYKDETTAHMIIKINDSPLNIINTMGGEYL